MQKNILREMVYRENYQPPLFLIDKVELTIHIQENFTEVKSKLYCQKNLNHSSSKHNLILSGENLKLCELILNESVLSDKEYEVNETSLMIYDVPDECVIGIIVQIQPDHNTSLNGLYRSRNYYCTQCEPEGFHHITYFLDRPDIMAQFTTTIIADKNQFPLLLSNGNLVETGEFSHTKHWARWVDPFKKPCYLFALVACDMDCLEDTFITRNGRNVTLKIYVEKGFLLQAHFAMQALKRAMHWDEVVFEREYDLDIYMIVAVSDFNMGAMENKGLNIFNDKYILASIDRATDQDFLHVESVIGHEYFHNWSGNRVTCRDWFQLSLKEGLTIFREQLFSSDLTSQTVARIDEVDYLRTVQFSEDKSPMRHAVRPDSYIEINNFYTATIYNKGAEVIRMLCTLIGEKAFHEGMNYYFETYDGQAVTIDDFIHAHEIVTNKDLTQFRLWYSQIGTPVIHVTEEYIPEKQSYSLTFKQTCPGIDENQKMVLHIPIEMGLLSEKGEEYFHSLLELREAQQTFTFENILSQPIPSLFRHFSAPIDLNYTYSNEALNVLFQYDTDAFNQREAGFRLAIRHILTLIKHPIISPEIKNYLFICRKIFNTLSDRWLLSRMLTLPSEKYLGEQMEIVDVEGIHASRELFAKTISDFLKEEFVGTWKTFNHSISLNDLSLEAMSNRALKNMCLYYLLLLDDPELHQMIGLGQFEKALGQNMTDAMAALLGLVNIPTFREDVLQKFYQQWKNYPLVLDKWFAAQAISKLPNTLNTVKTLMQHPAFDIRNPNKVYALIGTFGTNVAQFHQKNGEGYAFLAKTVCELDRLNPQVAARMVRPLMMWKRFDPNRQALMRDALTEISSLSKLSSDVYEIVTKSLKNEEKMNG